MEISAQVLSKMDINGTFSVSFYQYYIEIYGRLGTRNRDSTSGPLLLGLIYRYTPETVERGPLSFNGRLDGILLSKNCKFERIPYKK
jgi:hypothetical protein